MLHLILYVKLEFIDFQVVYTILRYLVVVLAYSLYSFLDHFCQNANLVFTVKNELYLIGF